MIVTSKVFIELIKFNWFSFDFVKEDGRRAIIDQTIEDHLFEMYHGAKFAMGSHSEVTPNHLVSALVNGEWTQRKWFTNKKSKMSFLWFYLLLNLSVTSRYPYGEDSQLRYNFLVTSFVKANGYFYFIGRSNNKTSSEATYKMYQHVFKLGDLFGDPESIEFDIEYRQNPFPS